jgi:RTA1 like protein
MLSASLVDTILFLSCVSPVLPNILFLQYERARRQDIVALVVQSVGGGIASGSQLVLGGHIALGGIALQLGLFIIRLLDRHNAVDTHAGVLILYTALATEFLVRFTLGRPMRLTCDSEGDTAVIPQRGTVGRKMRHMIFGMSVITVLLLIRSVYRTIELSGGWNGKVISTQWLFGQFACGCTWTQ